MVRVAGFEPARHTATDFKSVVSAYSTIPAYKVSEGLGYFYRLGFSQPYILSIAQTFEFVNTFLKKIFIFFGAGGFHFPTEQ